MKLMNKVTNVFFALIAVIGLFMPIIGYSTMLTGASYNIVDMVSFLKSFDPNAEVSLLSNLGTYGFKDEAILAVVFFVLMLVCLLTLLIISFLNVPYLARMIVSGLGLASYIVAVVCYLRIGNAFVNGVIPTSAITSLVASDSENILGSLIGAFASVTKMGLAAGAYVGMVSFGVLFITNTVFFIFRKRFALADGEEVPEKKSKHKKSKKGKKAKKEKK